MGLHALSSGDQRWRRPSSRDPMSVGGQSKAAKPRESNGLSPQVNPASDPLRPAPIVGGQPYSRSSPSGRSRRSRSSRRHDRHPCQAITRTKTPNTGQLNDSYSGSEYLWSHLTHASRDRARSEPARPRRSSGDRTLSSICVTSPLPEAAPRAYQPRASPSSPGGVSGAGVPPVAVSALGTRENTRVGAMRQL